MSKRFYLITRDLHLYSGLFISPFVLVFAISVFFLVHPPTNRPSPESAQVTTVRDLQIPSDIETLEGRARVDRMHSVLAQAGIRGEIGFIRHIPKEHRLVTNVTVPGRETTFDLDTAQRTAKISRREPGFWDGFILLHKSPGPHLVGLRMNWLPMVIWRWFADATVYLLLFISVSGIYLWTALRAERRIGIALIAAGAFSFFGILYALIR